jgi:hypothetical protein
MAMRRRTCRRSPPPPADQKDGLPVFIVDGRATVPLSNTMMLLYTCIPLIVLVYSSTSKISFSREC